jgi:hypothetical protein
MGLPIDVVERILDERNVVGLKFLDPQGAIRIYWLRVLSKEGPVNLRNFNLGDAAAMQVAGTDWNAIQDGTAKNYLEPSADHILYQIFYGISPSPARLFFRYLANVDRWSLRGTRTVGGKVGYIEGRSTRYLTPAIQSELFTVKGLNPNFLGYHPYAEPATQTIRMNFFIHKFAVEFMRSSLPLEGDQEISQRGRIVTMGGISPIIPAPDWLVSAATMVG